MEEINCPDCSRTFKSKSGLTLHMNAIHLTLSPSQLEQGRASMKPKNNSTVADELIGFNDHGIVEYNEGGAGLGFLIHGEWAGVCNSCGKKFKGKDEIETIRFGHKDCPSPEGKFIKGDITVEKIEKTIAQTRQQTLDECLEIVGEDEPEMTPNFFSNNWINHKNIYRNDLRQDLRQAINSLQITKK